MRIVRIIGLVILVGCSAAGAQTLADHVPGDAIAYAGWKGADTADTGYAGSHLQAVIDASGFAELRDQLVPQVMQKITEQSNDHGEGALAAKTVLGILWRHPSAAFFGGVTKGGNRNVGPKIGLICRAGSDGDALLTIFNAAANGQGAPPKAHAFAAGDLTCFLIGYSGADALPADASTSLAASPDFVRLTAETGKDGMLCGYADFSQALALIDDAVANGGDEEAKSDWPQARDASGIGGLKHFSFGAGFDGRDWKTSTFVDAPGMRGGLLTVLEPTPIDAVLLARIPATASTAIYGQLNFGELFKQVRAIAVAANPSAGDLFDKGMGLAQMMIGRSLQHDIFEPLGSQWAMYCDPSIPGATVTLKPDGNVRLGTMGLGSVGDNTIVVNKLVDPTKALQGWTMLSYAISNASAGWIRSHRVPVSMSMSKNGDDSVFTIVTPLAQPSWTIHNGFMYFGASPAGVIAAANAGDAPAGSLITQVPGFVGEAKQLDAPAEVSGFAYSDLPAAAPRVYPALEASVQQLRQMLAHLPVMADQSKEAATAGAIATLKAAINTYQVDTGEFPGSLDQLVNNSNGVASWHGPYIDKVPKDAWGNDFVYAPPTTPGAEFQLSSKGATGGGSEVAQQQSITLPEKILPPLDKLLPELTPALTLSWADAKGWHSRSREPFPGSTPQSNTGTIGGVALLTSILLPSLNRARETANRVKCASNERQVGQAILLFANDHRGAYPANIGDLLSAGDITPDVFLCPSSNSQLPQNYKAMAPADQAAWVTDHGDYVYCGAGMNTNAGADQIVLYEKPQDHGQGMNILFGDGHVEFDLMREAVKMIQDQHKTVPGVPLPGGNP